jgi:hypothetical protein
MQNRSPTVQAVGPATHRILAAASTTCGDSGIAPEHVAMLEDAGVKVLIADVSSPT